MLGFDLADARGGIDQILVELAAVVADRFDLASKLGLIFCRNPLVRTDGVELMITLFDGFGIGLRGGRRRGFRSDRGSRCRWDWRRSRLRQRTGVWQHQSHQRAEHEARIAAMRAAGNHAVQG